MKIAALADSLTGASVIGTAFNRAGHRTAVMFHDADLRSALETHDAVIVNSHTRPMNASDACARIQDIMGELREADFTFFKFDSSLRRPLLPELHATLEALGRTHVILMPAKPSAGFSTKHGVQLFHGRPLHETGFARNKRHPVLESHLPTLLERQGFGPVVVVERADMDTINQALQSHQCVVVDAASMADFKDCIKSVSPMRNLLWAGSSDLAEILAATHAALPRQRPQSGGSGGRTLIVAGGIGSTTNLQLQQLALEPNVIMLSLALNEVASGPMNAALDAVALSAEQAFAAGFSVALHVVAEAASAMPSGQDSLALNRLNQQVNEALTEITVRLGRAGQFSELILSGSDMAPGIFRRLGASGLTLEPEQLGLEWPVASLIGPVPIRVMTKAAGVGQPDGLVRAFRALMSGDSER